jgi:hypothetical protein
MLQSEAGYIDARPKSRQIDETLLQRTAGPYMWARSGGEQLQQILDNGISRDRPIVVKDIALGAGDDLG